MEHTIVMTGASRGIGRVAAEEIRRRSPETRLLVVGRTGADVTADLGSLESVRAAAGEIGARLDRGALPPLRGFVGNAGVQHTDARTETADGFEATFAVNVLANHLLVRLLEDRLTAPARIVITGSDSHFGDLRHNLAMVPAPRWDSPELLARTGAFPNPGTATAGRAAYSTSKLAVLYLVHEYARTLPPGIEAVAYNPGFVPGTGLARHAGPAGRFAMRWVLPALRLTPLATGPKAAGRRLADLALGATGAPTGAYVDRGRVARSSEESYDERREVQLWEAVERLTEPYRR